MTESLEARIDRLESVAAIRQLAYQYALAVDARALDALVSLFPEDVQVGRSRHGRAALKEWFDRTLRDRFTVTTHTVANHVVEFDDTDHARGVVYCRAEHEMGDDLVVAQMQYWDEYERAGGRWLFRRRRPLFWYISDRTRAPVGEKKIRWPNQQEEEAPLPGAWPTWERFWNEPPAGEVTVGRLPSPGRFLAFLQGK